MKSGVTYTVSWGYMEVHYAKRGVRKTWHWYRDGGYDRFYHKVADAWVKSFGPHSPDLAINGRAYGPCTMKSSEGRR